MVDTRDLKSLVRKGVLVRVQFRAILRTEDSEEEGPKGQ